MWPISPMDATLMPIEHTSHSPAQTLAIGQQLGAVLRAGDVLLLLGDLGAGKTQLVKGIVQGLGSVDLVTSPSFVLINEYVAGSAHANMRIYHVDLYRITDPADLTSIGLEEIWHEQGVWLIEWAERAQHWLPEAHLMVQIHYVNEMTRVIRFVPQGERYQQRMAEYKNAAGD